MPGVHGMEAVDVLVRRDGVRDARLVDVRRERQLDEDPVDLVVGVELVDEREDVRLGCVVASRRMSRASIPASVAAVLQPDVDVRGGVVADQHGREPDVTELLDLACDVGADPLRERLAVHERRRHARDSRRGAEAPRPSRSASRTTRSATSAVTSAEPTAVGITSTTSIPTSTEP